MNSLKVKLALLFLALATLTALPVKLHADGNPIPLCGGKACVPNG